MEFSRNLLRLRSRFAPLLALLACVAWLPANIAWGQDTGSWQPATDCPVSQCVPPRPGDDLWMISTRHLGCPKADGSDPGLQYLRYQIGTGWVESSQQVFRQGDAASVPTYIYVHGNRMNFSWAYRRSWTVYHALLAPRATSKIRYVFLAWPSDRIRGLLKDARAKADRTQNDAYYLAWLLSHMSPDVKVGIIAYSFGARISTGALHLHAGGELCGWKLTTPVPPKRSSVHLVTMAAALHSHWMSPGFPHARAPSRMARFLNLYNPTDSTLKRYRFLDECSSPVAMGFTGIYDRAPLGDRISEIDVACHVSRNHKPAQYLCNPQVMDMAWKALRREVEVVVQAPRLP
jgi:hypothetical protein